MENEKLQELKRLAEAATPQNLDSAQDATKPTGYIECPECGGDGTVELTADYCNYDGKALGVQFYGVGPEHRAAESFFRAANPAVVLELIAAVEAGNPASAAAVAAGTIDTPELQRLMEYWRGEPYGTRSFENAWSELIAHIDAAMNARAEEARRGAAAEAIAACQHEKTVHVPAGGRSFRVPPEVAEEIERLRAAQRTAGGDAVGWCIEKGPASAPLYLSAVNCVLDWAASHAHAFRFSRRADCELMCTVIEDADRIAEHAWTEPLPEADAAAILRDVLAIQEACGLHTDEYAPGSVIEYIKELEADAAQPVPEAAAQADDGFWAARIAENAMDVAFEDFQRLRKIVKVTGYCCGPKHTEREAFAMAVSAAAPTAQPTLPDDAEDAARWREMLEAVVAEIPDKHPNSNGDAPYHSHRRAGIWDEYNGPKSGKPCAWCKVWNEAKTAIAARAAAAKENPCSPR